jgi:tetratricopeptide (TPR) repeat protein
VRGQPLDQALPAGIGKPDAWEIGRQLADGLYAAHRSGVIHGDFKPGNVLVAPGQPPRPVIMDFGLARALGSQVPLGRAGVQGGTLDYMAPELIAGASPSIASDIFAFGKVAKLLLPGEKFWDECTRDDPAARPASMEEAVRHFRRDSTRRNLLLGGLATGATVLGYSIFHGREPAQWIESGARLLVNGFEAAHESLKGARLTRSLVITALRQSPRVRAIADQDLLPALRTLKSQTELPVEGDVLHRLLRIERAQYWVDGRLRENQGRFSLALTVLRSRDERLLAQTSFQDAPAAAAVATQAAVWIRSLAGESKQSLAANPAQVTAYTSVVPEALQNYYDAMEHYSLGEMAEALPLLEEALRLDSGFAQARAVRAMCLSSLRRPVEALEEIERALPLSANLPERERAWIRVFYEQLVEDPVQMVEAARRNLEFYPDEPRFLRVYGQTLCWVGRAAEALPALAKAVELAPTDNLLRNELVLALCEAGRFEDGLREYQSAAAPGSPVLARGAVLAYLGLGRYADAVREFGGLPEDPDLLTTGAKSLLGDMPSASAELQQQLARYRTEGNVTAEHRVREYLCGSYFLMDRSGLAREQVDQMLALPECPAMALRIQCVAFWAARLNHPDALNEAEAWLARVAARWDHGFAHATLTHARALQARQRSANRQAEALLLESLGSAFTVWTLFDLADLYAATGQAGLAEEYWQKWEQRLGTVLKRWFPGIVLYGWLRHGLTARQRGDAAGAALCARRILEHWGSRNPAAGIVQLAKTLSPNLQPL